MQHAVFKNSKILDVSVDIVDGNLKFQWDLNVSATIYARTRTILKPTVYNQVQVQYQICRAPL